MGIVYESEKQTKAAIAAYLESVKLDPKRADAHYRLAMLYRATGDKAKAQAEFAKVNQLHQVTAQDALRKVSGRKPEPPNAE
jgi:tetratricopeptide (TPR) repeat protein